MYDKNLLTSDKHLGSVTINLRKACGSASKLGVSTFTALETDGDRSKLTWWAWFGFWGVLGCWDGGRRASGTGCCAAPQRVEIGVLHTHLARPSSCQLQAELSSLHPPCGLRAAAESMTLLSGLRTMAAWAQLGPAGLSAAQQLHLPPPLPPPSPPTRRVPYHRYPVENADSAKYKSRGELQLAVQFCRVGASMRHLQQVRVPGE